MDMDIMIKVEKGKAEEKNNKRVVELQGPKNA